MQHFIQFILSTFSMGLLFLINYYCDEKIYITGSKQLNSEIESCIKELKNENFTQAKIHWALIEDADESEFVSNSTNNGSGLIIITKGEVLEFIINESYLENKFNILNEFVQSGVENLRLKITGYSSLYSILKQESYIYNSNIFHLANSISKDLNSNKYSKRPFEELIKIFPNLIKYFILNLNKNYIALRNNHSNGYLYVSTLRAEQNIRSRKTFIWKPQNYFGPQAAWIIKTVGKGQFYNICNVSFRNHCISIKKNTNSNEDKEENRIFAADINDKRALEEDVSFDWNFEYVVSENLIRIKSPFLSNQYISEGDENTIFDSSRSRVFIREFIADKNETISDLNLWEIKTFY